MSAILQFLLLAFCSAVSYVQYSNTLLVVEAENYNRLSSGTQDPESGQSFKWVRQTHRDSTPSLILSNGAGMSTKKELYEFTFIGNGTCSLTTGTYGYMANVSGIFPNLQACLDHCADTLPCSVVSFCGQPSCGANLNKCLLYEGCRQLTGASSGYSMYSYNKNGVAFRLDSIASTYSYKGNESFYTLNNMFDTSNAVRYCDNKNISSLSYFSNQVTCAGRNYDFAQRIFLSWYQTCTITWSWRLGMDWGRGGAVYLDGRLITNRTTDTWWGLNWNSGGVINVTPFTLRAGKHRLVIIGFESCCDGQASVQYKLGTNDWNDFYPDGFLKNLDTVGCPLPDPTNFGVQPWLPRLSYDIYFDNPGVYSVWVRGYAEHAGEDTCFVGLDGQLPCSYPTGCAHTMNVGQGVSAEWTKRTYATLANRTLVVLDAGYHTLDVWMGEPNFLIDKILLVDEVSRPNYTPQGLGAPESLQENEPGDTMFATVSTSTRDTKSVTLAFPNSPEYASGVIDVENIMFFDIPIPAATFSVTVDNEYEIYFDGVKQSLGGNTRVGVWQDSEQWIIPPTTRYLAIHGYDTGGAAGILGSFSTGQVTNTDWKCHTGFSEEWVRSNFSTRDWPNARTYGANGASPWGFQAGISATAQWIWTQDNNNVNEVTCVFYLPGYPTFSFTERLTLTALQLSINCLTCFGSGWRSPLSLRYTLFPRGAATPLITPATLLEGWQSDGWSRVYEPEKDDLLFLLRDDNLAFWPNVSLVMEVYELDRNFTIGRVKLHAITGDAWQAILPLDQQDGRGDPDGDGWSTVQILASRGTFLSLPSQTDWANIDAVRFQRYRNGVADGTSTQTNPLKVRNLAFKTQYINCTLASNCGALHRFACDPITSTKSNVCGECLPGYVNPMPDYYNTTCVSCSGAGLCEELHRAPCGAYGPDTCGPCTSPYTGDGRPGNTDSCVDCSGAPDCGVLHRKACGTAPAASQKCGSCVSGYVGTAGPSNENDCIVDCSLAPDCNSLHRAACGEWPNSCGDCTGDFAGAPGPSNQSCVYGQCLGAPDCARLHREDCTTVPNTCGPCIEGYYSSGEAGASNRNDCQDINECTAGIAACAPEASCTNTIGSFICACNEGWVGDGLFCQDEDECEDQHAHCDQHATCRNTPGSYSCICNAGWSGDGLSCEDVNECQFLQCDAHAFCTNTPGSYYCVCGVGWFGTGLVCQDNDECASPTTTPCSSYANCTNTPGSFVCGCNFGYEGDGLQCAVSMYGGKIVVLTQNPTFQPNDPKVIQLNREDGWYGRVEVQITNSKQSDWAYASWEDHDITPKAVVLDSLLPATVSLTTSFTLGLKIFFGNATMGTPQVIVTLTAASSDSAPKGLLKAGIGAIVALVFLVLLIVILLIVAYIKRAPLQEWLLWKLGNFRFKKFLDEKPEAVEVDLGTPGQEGVIRAGVTETEHEAEHEERDHNGYSVN